MAGHSATAGGRNSDWDACRGLQAGAGMTITCHHDDDDARDSDAALAHCDRSDLDACLHWLTGKPTTVTRTVTGWSVAEPGAIREEGRSCGNFETRKAAEDMGIRKGADVSFNPCCTVRAVIARAMH